MSRASIDRLDEGRVRRVAAENPDCLHVNLARRFGISVTRLRRILGLHGRTAELPRKPQRYTPSLRGNRQNWGDAMFGDPVRGPQYRTAKLEERFANGDYKPIPGQREVIAERMGRVSPRDRAEGAPKAPPAELREILRRVRR